MTAAREVRPSGDLKPLLGDSARFIFDVARSDRDADRNLTTGREDPAELSLVIDERSRASGPGEPVGADVSEYPIDRHGRSGVGPVVKSLDDPGQLPHRRIRQCVHHRRRTLSLDDAVGRELLAVANSRGADPRVLGLTIRGIQGVDVDAHDMLRMPSAKRKRDVRSPVTTLRSIMVIPKPGHELTDCVGHPLDLPSALKGGPGESKTGQRGNHQVHRVTGIAAVRARIAEWPQDVEKFHDRARPAMTQHDGQSMRLGRPNVQSVHLAAVDGGHELWIRVDLRLEGAPVKRRLPVGDKRFQLIQRSPERPRLLTGQPRRPPGSRQSLPKVKDLLVRDGNAEGSHADHHSKNTAPRRLGDGLVSRPIEMCPTLAVASIGQDPKNAPLRRSKTRPVEGQIGRLFAQRAVGERVEMSASAPG